MNRSVHMPSKAMRLLRRAVVFLFHPDLKASDAACDTAYWFLAGKKPVRYEQ